MRLELGLKHNMVELQSCDCLFSARRRIGDKPIAVYVISSCKHGLYR